MIVPFSPRPSASDAWSSPFPITSAWMAAYGAVGELWLSAVGETTRAFADLARAQTALFCDAVACGFGAAGASGLACEAAETALHAVEDLGPGDPEFIPLPE